MVAVATSLLGELKRRNVFRAVALYAAAAWLLVQVATQVFPFFHAPEWVVRWIIVAAVAALPLFVAFAWFYEFTPEGIKRQSDVEPTESIVHLTARKLDRWIIVLLILIALLMLAQIFVLPKAGADNAVAGAAPAANASAPAKSIAVLPFENLSKDENNAYFATGMQDMILTELVGIGGLKVISRTSTEKYPSHPEDVKSIARQLGVATLLEGTVQKVGDQVLINVQLIEAESGNHLWAKAYTRTLDNVFNVEGEVAQNVAQALKVQLTSAETARIDTAPTQNAAAYDLYLQAGAHANRAYDDPVLSSTELPVAISLYRQALDKDPHFALAAAALARAHMQMYFFGPDRTNERLVEAKTAADRALTLQPKLGQAHYALGLYYYWGHRDYAAANPQLELAREALPNSATVELLIAAVARRQGRWDEAVKLFHNATVLDPHSEFAFNQLGVTYQSLRRYADAEQAYAAAMALSRSPAGGRVTLGFNQLMWKGDPVPLRTALAALKPGGDGYAGNIMAMYFERSLARDYAGAIKVAEADQAENWDDPDNIVLPRRLYLAWAFQSAGDTAKATAAYTEVAEHARAGLVERPDDADLHLALGFAYAGLGRKAEAVAEGERAVALMPITKDVLTGAGMLACQAQLYVRVGQPDQAIALIDRVLSMPTGGILSSALLKLDPSWDPLRDDPRFKALLQKYSTGS